MRNYLIGALAGALVASAVGGFAYAATMVPTSTNTINACYSNSSGASRVATTPCDTGPHQDAIESAVVRISHR